MKINELIQIGTREESYDVIVIDASEIYDEETGQTIPAVTHTEKRIRSIPIMRSTTRDVTAEELTELTESVFAGQSEELTDAQRMDEIEAAIMELASMIAGAE